MKLTSNFPPKTEFFPQKCWDLVGEIGEKVGGTVGVFEKLRKKMYNFWW